MTRLGVAETWADAYEVLNGGVSFLLPVSQALEKDVTFDLNGFFLDNSFIHLQGKNRHPP